MAQFQTQKAATSPQYPVRLYKIQQQGTNVRTKSLAKSNAPEMGSVWDAKRYARRPTSCPTHVILGINLCASFRALSIRVTFLIPNAIVYPSTDASFISNASASPSIQTSDEVFPYPAK